jgi:hypothetical protein
MPSVLSADALTTLANLKAEVGIADADTSQDARLERAINRATWMIENETKRKFNEGMQGGLKARKYTDITVPGTYTTTGVANEDYVYFSGSTTEQGGDTLIDERGCGVFHLPAYPVQPNSVLAFQLHALSSRGGGAETWDTSSHVEFDTFALDRANGVLRLMGGFTPGFRNYRIQMAAGYLYGSAQPCVPPDLEGVCVEIAKGMFNDDRAVLGESLGTWSRQYSVTLKQEDPFVRATIGRYLRPVL